MTGVEAVDAASTAVDNAMDRLLEVVMEAVEAEARRAGITRMDFGPWATELFKGEDPVKNTIIQAVEDEYLKHHAQGFLNYWTETEGWT